jgi:hypothetical protein
MEDINQLYREITKRAKANGVVDQEGWDGIVDEVIEQYRTTEGEIDTDEDTQGMVEDLRARFGEYDEVIREDGFGIDAAG